MVMLQLIVISVLLYVIFWQINLIYATIKGAPIVYSSEIAVIDCFKLVKLKKGELVVDLGCGSGKSLIIASEKFNAKGVGVEISPYAYLLARTKKIFRRQKNYDIIFGDFKKAEPYLKKADVVYLYLLNSVLENIEDWLFKTISKDCRVVSLAFVFKKHKAKRTIETFTLYHKTKAYLYGK